jgi:hypothetical protein
MSIRSDEVEEWVNELQNLETPLTVDQAIESLTKFLEEANHPNSDRVTAYYVKKFTKNAGLKLRRSNSIKPAENFTTPPFNPQPKNRRFDNICILATTSVEEEKNKKKK